MKRLKANYEGQVEALQIKLDAWQIRAVRPKLPRKRTETALPDLLVSAIQALMSAQACAIEELLQQR